MAVPEDLLAIMQCIECGEGLEEVADALRCTGCGLHYPVTDGIPVMLAEEAYRPEGA
jgi:uncharacterized protein YbaR (Trm112 family)